MLNISACRSKSKVVLSSAAVAARRVLRVGGVWLGCVCLGLGLSQAPVMGQVQNGGQVQTGAQVEKVVEDRLKAGEFGFAVETALGVKDVGERTRLLRRIVAAQRQAGEFAAAETTAGYIPAPKQRAETRAATARQRNLRGGGSGADFDAIMDLMKSTIAPESWDDVGGPGSVRPFDSGIRVDPQGLLKQVTKEEATGRLAALGSRARTADIHDDMARSSELRMVSLVRLEKAVGERLRQGEAPLETMQRLAGITQIRYIFVYPDEGDIVIAGPAEGWRYDDQGRPVGQQSNRPMLQLDDLVVTLRVFGPQGKGVYGCQINPRPENLKSVKDYTERTSRVVLPPGATAGWLREIQKRMGLMDVVVYGVPANTRVAQVLVEADYRMKLIGIGKVDGGPEIPNYFDLLKKAGKTAAAPMDTLRWWMTMKYAAVLHSSDHNAFEIQGSSVLVQSENQFVNAQGQNLETGVAEPINRKFAENFTTHYAKLAQRDHIFADLQNQFDLGMLAALIRSERLGDKVNWNLGVFAADGLYRPADLPAPKVVDSVLAYRTYNGTNLVVQVAGGVTADVMAVVKDKALSKEDPQVKSVSQRAAVQPALPAGRWWWDAK